MMKKILCVVLMGVLGLSGSLWAVDTPKRERPFFENEGEAGEMETKDEPAEDDIDMVALSAVNYQENGGGTSLNLESIPEEVWMAILEFLDLSDLVRLAQVSQFFHRLIQDEAVLGPSKIWSHYEGLSRFPGDDQSALNGKLVNFLRDWEAMPSLLEEHFFYLLQRFVEWGADLDTGDYYGYSPLHWAVRSGHEEIVRLLEDHYNDGGNVADAPELAPLRQAEEVGNVEGDGNLIDVRNIHDNGVGDWTREQLLGALVLVGALTYSMGCNLL